MSDSVQHAIHSLLENRPLNEEAAAEAIGTIMDGRADELHVAALLTALRVHGESVDVLVGAARAMRDRATRIPVGMRGLLDTCGTGGDGLATFNISTAAAIVAASAGVSVAKHGNRAASSTSGSADVLETLGVRLDLTPEHVAECIREIGIGFCFAPQLHGAMKNVVPIRKRLGFRTVFNLLGPLTNPANADYQLVGTGRIGMAQMMAEALTRLPVERAVVVCGNDEIDEVSLWGMTTAFVVENKEVNRVSWNVSQLTNRSEIDPARLRVDSPEASAETIRAVLDNRPGPARDMVVVNTAVALWVAGVVEDFVAGTRRADELISSGAAKQKLDLLVKTTQSLAVAR